MSLETTFTFVGQMALQDKQSKCHPTPMSRVNHDEGITISAQICNKSLYLGADPGF